MLHQFFNFLGRFYFYFSFVFYILSTRVFETRTATGSELFSLLTCPHTTTFTLLSIFSPLEISSIKPGRQYGPGTRNVLFRLPSASQKRACLSSLYLVPLRATLAIYANNSRHLARKYARIFVRGHYLFREANSFPRAKLEENCELRGTDNVQGQIPEHIFAPNGGHCLYYP